MDDTGREEVMGKDLLIGLVTGAVTALIGRAFGLSAAQTLCLTVPAFPSGAAVMWSRESDANG